MASRIYTHRLAVVIGGVILLLLLAIATIIIFSESIVRRLVEGKGSEVTGRELRIDGPVVIDWHWTYTQARATRIRLANAAGYPEPNMVAVEELAIRFKPLGLLRGKMEIGTVIIKKPVIILERKSLEDNNWTFSTANKGNETVNDQDRRKFPLIERLQVTEGNIVYRDAIRKMNLELALDSVSGTDDVDSSQQIKHEFTITGKGDLQNHPFTLQASTGSLESLRDPGADFPLDIEITMDKTRVEMKGIFKDPFRFSGVDASLKITGDNLADLFYLTAIPLPPTPPYRLEGQLTKQDGVWGYREFTGEVGGSDLSGNLSYDIGGARGFLQADLLSNVLDSADLGGFIGLPPPLDDEKATPEQKRAAAEKEASPRLIPDVPLHVERLRATDLDVKLNAKKINAPNVPFKGMEVRFNLRDGQLTLDPLKVILADGTLDGVINIDARPDIPPMKAQLNLRNLSLGRFFDNTRFANTTKGFFGGKVALAGTGASLADVLASSNGELALIMSGGQISRLLIEASDIDIGEALPLFLGKDKSTDIRCGVLDFAVRDGMLKSKTLVLDTGDSLLVGRADINLKDEKINARLDAKPKDQSLLSARIPITLSGDLKSPSIGLDPERTGARSAAAIALGTLLTPFAALLAFVERGDAENVDCHALIAATK